jgi:transmembrane 9 superfamily protein 3
MGWARVVLLLSLLALVSADYKNHKYVAGEEVILWVNKVGPLRNPQETYLYYSLPWCVPQGKEEIIETETPREGLGEALMGYELRRSGIDVKFQQDLDATPICTTKPLSEGEAKRFKYAITNNYWFQMYLDDLPIFGGVGDVIDDKHYIFAHKKFIVTYNEDRVIQVNLTNENLVPVESGEKIEFTYSVNWYPSNIPFEDRFDYYLDDNFFEHQIHWFSIFNSFMMVVFLAGLVSMILMRTLRKDFVQIQKSEEDLEDDRDVGDESGWKQIHGDVFRAPPHLLLFSALVGTGHQLSLLVFSVIIFSIIGTYYRTRGSMLTAFIFLYAITSFIGGYGAGGFYARNGGKHWIKSFLLTGGLFPGLCFLMASLLNFIAIGYGTLAAFPAGTIFAVLAIWLFISYPMTFVGTVFGKNWNGHPDNPCRINPVPRRIPDRKWYLQPYVNVILGGILPFGSIFIEMYFVFTSVWHYKYYYVYGFMLLVYVILIIVTICVTVVSTYFLLNSEDYRWQWTSFLSAASTAMYVYLYALYYYVVKTKMTGFYQTSFYFGYMIMFCVGLGILCGAIGFIGTSVFVRKIFKNVKIE